MTEERREFPRQTLTQDVHCYIDGVRFDARTMDVSAGGAYVRTPRAGSVSPGALVGMVFLRHPVMLHTTFLFGRVVRVRIEAPAGLALAWEKAVTVAPAEDLAKFLDHMFGIRSPVIRPEASGARGQVRNVFSFGSISTRTLAGPPWASEAPEAAGGPQAVPPVERGPASQGAAALSADSSPLPRVEVEVPDPFDAAAMGAGVLAVTAADLDALEVKIIALERDGTPACEVQEVPPSRPDQRAPGQISVMVAREDVPVSMPAVLSLGEDALSLTIRQLGASRALVRTAFVPMDRDSEMMLRLDIPARRGPVSVTCRCTLEDVLASDDARGPGLTLRFTALDEADSPGVLERYVKFLQFHQLARA